MPTDPDQEARDRAKFDYGEDSAGALENMMRLTAELQQKKAVEKEPASPPDRKD